MNVSKKGAAMHQLDDVQSIAPRAMSDDEWQAFKVWGSAIVRWQEGDAEPIRALLLAHEPLPDFVREFLADLAAGKVKRRRGAPPKYSGDQERALYVEVMQSWDQFERAPMSRDNSGPRDAAIVKVAGDHAMRPDALRGIIERLHAVGMTRKFWPRMRKLDDGHARPMPGP